MNGPLKASGTSPIITALILRSKASKWVNGQMAEDSLVRMEKATVQMEDGRKMSLVYAVPSNPDRNPTCLIIAHGAGGPMYSPFITYFHTALAKKGFLTVKFNFPYMEARKRVPDRRDVLEASYMKIVEHVKLSKYSPSHLFIGGKSMGGRIASQITAAGAEVDGVFFFGYPLHPPGKLDRLRDEHLYKISKPMLFISGTKDAFASKTLLEKVITKLGPNANAHWVEGGDHSFNTGQGKDALAKTHEELLGVLMHWVGKCLSR